MHINYNILCNEKAIYTKSKPVLRNMSVFLRKEKALKGNDSNFWFIIQYLLLMY